MKKLWNDICFYLLLGASKAVGCLPYRVLYYGVAEVIYFFLYKVVGYRVNITRSNLTRSFPEKSDEERMGIERRFYRHLAEVFVDTFYLTVISEKAMRRRFVYENVDQTEATIKGRSWIAAMAHYGSWEYTVGFSLFVDHEVQAVYRPVHNEVFDRFYRHLRSRFGVRPVPMHDVMREMVLLSRKGAQPAVVAMIGDQTPPIFERRHWYDFLGQDTPFFAGMGKMATRFRMPVFFLHITKLKRGYYTSRFIEIYNGVDDLTEHEIMERYVHHLESMIRETPELWMWSHRRWKHKRRKTEPDPTGESSQE